jgi:hypothetical protein
MNGTAIDALAHNFGKLRYDKQTRRLSDEGDAICVCCSLKTTP